MNEKHWRMFFDLLDGIVNFPGLSADEKRNKVKEEAEKNGGTINLEEFACWFQEE